MSKKASGKSTKKNTLDERVMCLRPNHRKRTLKTWGDVETVLSGLNEDDYFAVFELADDSYVQILGIPDELTVEVRVVGKDGSFKHYVSGKGRLAGKEACVGPANGPNGERMTIDRSQVLEVADARLIVATFLGQRELHKDYKHRDISKMFENGGGSW